MGIFLFFEYQLDKDKYRYENIADFSQKHKKAIENYKKTLEYSFIDHLSNTNFSNLILEKNTEELDNYIYVNYEKLFSDDFRYVNIYDEKANLIYSLNDSYSVNDKNEILDLAKKNQRQTQGYVFTKNVQSYRFVYPYFLNNKIVAYIDVGLDAAKLSNNLEFTGYDQVDFLIKKNYFDGKVTNLKYRDSNISYAHYHINALAPNYSVSYRKSIQLEIDRNLTKKENFVFDILNDNVFLNQLLMKCF